MQKEYFDGAVSLKAETGLDLFRTYDGYRAKEIFAPLSEEQFWTEVTEAIPEEEANGMIEPVDQVKYFTDIVQSHLDGVAKTRNYDGILSLCSYVTSTNATFSKEGQAGVEWRDAVWAKCYEILDAVKAGTRTDIPTAEQLILELPVFTWGD